jgi:hypothetical protein
VSLHNFHRGAEDGARSELARRIRYPLASTLPAGVQKGVYAAFNIEGELLRIQRTARFLHYQKLHAVAAKAVERDVYHQKLMHRVRVSITRSREMLGATASHDTRAWPTGDALSAHQREQRH